MFKLVREKLHQKIASRALMMLKVDVVYCDDTLTHRYRNLSVVQEDGSSHLCYDYQTENTELATGLAIGVALENPALGVLLCDNSESAYCDLLTGNRVYPDKSSPIKYMSAIRPIKEEDIDKGRITLRAEQIRSMLNNYDNARTRELSRK